MPVTRLSRRRRRLVAALLVCAAAALHASSPKFFQAATQTDFLKGDVENLSIDSHGQLTLGPATELVYERRRRSCGRGRRRPTASLFVGTGNEGKVFRVDAAGQGRRCSSTAPSSRCTRSRSRPTAASTSAPRPTGRSTRSIATASLDARSSIRTTSTSGRWPSTARAIVFAGTGEKGVVYKITPDGKGTPFYKTKATHATALAFDKAGNLLVGTESPGSVLRIDADGKAFVLLDSPFQEIRALRFDDKGMLYVAAVNGRPQPACGAVVADAIAGRSPAATPAARRCRRSRSRPRSRRSSIVDTAGGGTSAPRRAEDRRAPKGAVYRIAPDGVWDQLWESRDDSPYDLTFDADGRADRRHRQQGQALSPRRRSAAADAARARQRAAGHGVLQGRARPAVLRDRQSREAVPPVAGARAARHLRVRRRATRRWCRRGARSAGAARMPADSRIELFTRVGQHRNARRDVERVVGRLHERRRLADHQPEGAVSAVARGADRQAATGPC